MIKLKLIFFLMFCWFRSNAQHNNVWCFGDSARVDFLPSLSVSHSNVSTMEVAASYADSLGNLLFYIGTSCIGCSANWSLSVWDSTNQIVPNGTNLFGQSSICQGAMIIPDPGSDSLFYIFHIGGVNAFPWTQQDLHYSILNKNLNSGLGAITVKNHFLYSSVSEKLTAVKHANGRDWWIVAHQENSSTFVMYLLTSKGIASVPLLQSIGYTFDSCCTYAAGQMLFNKSGNKLCLATYSGLLELFDFDRCTGYFNSNTHLSDSVFIDYAQGYYGCSFSNDGSKLYASKSDSLFQFDLNATNISLSQTLIVRMADDTTWLGQHLIGPDNQIYIALLNPYQIEELAQRNTSLSVIHSPDSSGGASNFDLYGLSLNGHHSILSLPNMPNYNLGADSGSVCDTLTALYELKNKKNQISVYPNPTSNQLTIDNLQFTINKQVTVTIYDVLGKQKMQQDFTVSGDGKIEMDVSGLTTGIYFLNLAPSTSSGSSGAETVWRSKFVKE